MSPVRKLHLDAFKVFKPGSHGMVGGQRASPSFNLAVAGEKSLVRACDLEISSLTTEFFQPSNPLGALNQGP